MGFLSKLKKGGIGKKLVKKAISKDPIGGKLLGGKKKPARGPAKPMQISKPGVMANPTMERSGAKPAQPGQMAGRLSELAGSNPRARPRRRGMMEP